LACLLLASCSQAPTQDNHDFAESGVAETPLNLKMNNDQSLTTMPDPATMNAQFEQFRMQAEQSNESRAELDRALQRQREADLEGRVEALERQRLNDRLVAP